MSFVQTSGCFSYKGTEIITTRLEALIENHNATVESTEKLAEPNFTLSSFSGSKTLSLLAHLKGGVIESFVLPSHLKATHLNQRVCIGIIKETQDFNNLLLTQKHVIESSWRVKSCDRVFMLFLQFKLSKKGKLMPKHFCSNNYFKIFILY